MTTTETCDPDCQERTECDVVDQAGHWQCGICQDCGRPRHHCGHINAAALAAIDAVLGTEPQP